MSVSEFAKAREARCHALRATLCGACKGSGYSRPGIKCFRVPATVCGTCLGRGMLIPRELSSGSWFEPEQTPASLHAAVAGRAAAEARKGRPRGTGRSRRKFEDW